MAFDGTLTIQDLAYAAGIIDGEGSIMIKRAKTVRHSTWSREYRVFVSVSNTNRLLLEWLLLKFGGSIKHYANTRPRSKSVYTWTMSAKASIYFLKLIAPCVLLKKEQLETAIEFQTSVVKDGKKLSEKTLMFRDDCFLKARELNKRGV